MALALAERNGRPDVAEIIRRGPANSPLRDAVAEANVAEVRRLISGTDINAKDKNGLTGINAGCLGRAWLLRDRQIAIGQSCRS